MVATVRLATETRGHKGQNLQSLVASWLGVIMQRCGQDGRYSVNRLVTFGSVF